MMNPSEHEDKNVVVDPVDDGEVPQNLTKVAAVAAGAAAVFDKPKETDQPQQQGIGNKSDEEFIPPERWLTEAELASIKQIGETNIISAEAARAIARTVFVNKDEFLAWKSSGQPLPPLSDKVDEDQQ